MSGGERQRILIARGLLRDADIYLFDEATSNIDPNNETKIMKQITELLKGKTVVLSAHRLTSVMDCDKIVVVDKGKVAEEGTHEELLAKEGSLYTNLWRNFIGESSANKK
jgi:ATP-binding cassette subfamily B protein